MSNYWYIEDSRAHKPEQIIRIHFTQRFEFEAKTM